MQTIKIKIKHNIEDKIFEYQKQYSSVLHVCFNHFKRDFENNCLETLFNYKVLKSPLMQTIKNMKNINLLQVWLIQCALSEAYQLFKSYQSKLNEYNQKLERKQELLNNQSLTYLEKKELKKLNKVKFPKVIFGGKENFIQRCKQQISKEEFKLNRLSLLYSIGMNAAHGNKIFRISEDLTKIIFQPKCKEKYELELIGVTKGYKQILSKLYIHQLNKDLPITYKLSTEYVYISFE